MPKYIVLTLAACLIACAPTLQEAKLRFDQEKQSCMTLRDQAPEDEAWRLCMHDLVLQILKPSSLVPKHFDDLIAYDLRLAKQVASGAINNARRDALIADQVLSLRVAEQQAQNKLNQQIVDEIERLEQQRILHEQLDHLHRLYRGIQ